MKLSFKEIKLTGLWARNRVDIQKILILKFAFGPAKFPGLLRKRSLDSRLSRSTVLCCAMSTEITQLNVISDIFGSRCFRSAISFFCPNYAEFNIVSTFLLREKIIVFLFMNFTYIFRSVILAIAF